MKWSSTVSTAPDLDAAVEEAAARVRTDLGAPPDLAVVFVSPHHREGYRDLGRKVAAALSPRTLIGCSAGGVIGGGREVEESPGVSMTAARLPGVDVKPFHLERALDPADDRFETKIVASTSSAKPDFLLLADPFSFDVETFLAGLDARFPASAKIGGLASGGRLPGENVLLLDGETHHDGLVGVSLSGDVRVDTLVAQGCRPVGDPMFVTACDRNMIRALDGRPPLDVLQDLYEGLDARDRELFRHSLFVGLVMRDKSEVYRQGDFLIRNIVGIDAEKSAIAVGAILHEGAIVQFHLRDAKTSTADLDAILAELSHDEREAVCGSLLFSCLGRGKHLYGQADHDTDAFRRHVGDVPLGGFFCNGEIGPVHGTTFLHGYTSSFGLFRPRDRRGS